MERRVIVFLVFLAVLGVLAATAYFLFLYRAPSCTDSIQNGREEGVDCGGSCPYLCNASLEAPTVLFTKALPSGTGRTDVIALVENKNRFAAARDVPYTVAVYGYDQALIQRVEGTLELPPGASVPVFYPGIASGKAAPASAFLSIDIDTIKWYALPEDPRVLPRVSDTVLGGATTSPRITAIFSNPDVLPMKNVRAVVLVESGAGNAIAASETLLASIPPQGRAIATFTWNAAFPEEPARIQVLPVIPLPVPKGAAGTELP